MMYGLDLGKNQEDMRNFRTAIGIDSVAAIRATCSRITEARSKIALTSLVAKRALYTGHMTAPPTIPIFRSSPRSARRVFQRRGRIPAPDARLSLR